jgi:hypothetical protein
MWKLTWAQMIDEMETMVVERLRLYKKRNEALPERIIFYRNGVSALTHNGMGHVTIAVGSAAGNGAGDCSMDSRARALRAPVTRSAQYVWMTACCREAFSACQTTYPKQ